MYGPEVTHVVFQSSRKNDITKEFRIARDEGKFVVAPQWVGMCHDLEERIDESAFSHTYNPKMALQMSVTTGTVTVKSIFPLFLLVLAKLVRRSLI